MIKSRISGNMPFYVPHNPTMARDSSAAATKQDIGMLMDYISKIEIKVDELGNKIDDCQEKTDQHFVLLEKRIEDCTDAFSDRIALHDDQIAALQRHTGFRR